ncbi:MAG: hypothetical protein GY715_12015 [Planctomycetes bacterium]|nr:hypothetical protein [Planctomycetota bacterium]
MNASHARLTAAALAAALALVAPAAAEETPSEPVASTGETPSDYDTDPRHQQLLLEAAFDAEEDYRTRLARLQRLLELATDNGDRVRMEQVEELRQRALELGFARRKAHHQKLVGDWRQMYEEQLELAASAVVIRTRPASSTNQAPARVTSDDDTSVFERRRQASRSRIASRRDDAQERQQAARDAARRENDFARRRVAQREAIRARTAQTVSTRRGANTTEPAPTASTSTDTNAKSTAATASTRPAPRPLLISHQDAYSKASVAIHPDNASRVFWALRDEITSELKAMTRGAARRAAAGNTPSGGGRR